jgi:uncharacterized protein YjbI with pentapeptide repeats
LVGATFADAKLYRTNLSECALFGAYFKGADLRSANLTYARTNRANFENADLRWANLQKTVFGEADLTGANLSEADLREANLSRAKLIGTNLTGARLARAELKQADLARADLTGANLSQANLSEGNLTGATLTGASLVGANLSRTILVETSLEKADLSGCRIYGISAWNLRLEKAEQKGLIITPDNEHDITVDDLEVAQLIYLLLHYEKLRKVFNSITERGVLILGRFGGGGLDVLEALATSLREMKYLPIIFTFSRPEGRNYTETIKTLVGLSRFVIADLSGPSVPQELYATVPHYKIPFVPIIESGKKMYSMSTDILEYPWVIRPPVEFKSREHLIEIMTSDIVVRAEKKHEERGKLLAQLFGAVN